MLCSATRGWPKIEWKCSLIYRTVQALGRNKLKHRREWSAVEAELITQMLNPNGKRKRSSMREKIVLAVTSW